MHLHRICVQLTCHSPIQRRFTNTYSRTQVSTRWAKVSRKIESMGEACLALRAPFARCPNWPSSIVKLGSLYFWWLSRDSSCVTMAEPLVPYLSAVGHCDICANTVLDAKLHPNNLSLPAATQLAYCHTACLLPHSSLMIYRLPTVHSLPTATQLANSHSPSFCRSYQSRGNSSR
jgi:hypothetical protein